MYCVVYASVREDNPRVLASGLSPVHMHTPYNNVFISPVCILHVVHYEIFDVNYLNINKSYNNVYLFKFASEKIILKRTERIPWLNFVCLI